MFANILKFSYLTQLELTKNKKKCIQILFNIQVFLDQIYIKQSQSNNIPEDIFEKFVLQLIEIYKYYNPKLFDTIFSDFCMPKKLIQK
ncbi:unnamed protein product [Paramecium pentaurelia]|uniref:Uncharacterized protein n=1 Tax=Paramecium pentaurelia TaxID=43138 RepID=A0A8S1UZS4_9CILI|nr:unnamed protein product [Paramecium pentaurelia]